MGDAEAVSGGGLTGSPIGGGTAPIQEADGMKPYWITVERLPLSSLNLGIGVTAHSADDACQIVRTSMPSAVISSVRCIEDMREIEQRHVAPNMEPDWLARGVWYPAGYR